MKKQALAALALVMLLALSAVPLPASAALLPSWWAEDELELARQWGLLDARPGVRRSDWRGWGSPGASGLSDPESYTAAITKDQFCQLAVNLCERLLGKTIPAADVRFSDEETPDYYYKAYRAGIVNGAGAAADGTVDPGRAERFSREQTAKMLYRAIVYCYPDEAIGETSAEALLADFSDRSAISGWALEGAAYMTRNGILRGSGGRFLPGEQCSFEQGVILAKRVYESFAAGQALSSAPMLQSGLSAPEILSPQGDPASLRIRDGVKLSWKAMSGAARYLVKYDCPGQARTQYAYTDATELTITPRGNEALQAGQLSVSVAAVDQSDRVISPSARLAVALYNDPDYYFDFTPEEAAQYMTTVTVQVWDFDAGGAKVTRTKSLTVHKWVAADVIAIFDEIYNGPERFPIHSIGGYRKGTSGEHPKGTAVDINPNENYELYADGRIGAGSFWKPGENPYSIPADGDVVRAFRARGWGWGGADWSNKNDYMHFSYFGK